MYLVTVRADLIWLLKAVILLHEGGSGGNRVIRQSCLQTLFIASNLFPAYGLYTLRDKIVQGDRNGNDGGGWEWLEILGPSGTTVRTSAKSCG